MSEKKKSVYAGIADDIISKIKNDEYAIGTLLPPEREFMGIYKVQRTTVRRGLDILSAEGYIRKVAGLGSVVQSKEPVVFQQVAAPAVTYEKQSDSKPKSISILLSLDSKGGFDKLPKFVLDFIVSLNKKGIGFMTSDVSEIKTSNSVIAIDTDSDIPNPHCLALCQSDDKRSVILDNDKGAYVALTYLEELGHKDIAYIGTDSGLSFENAAYDSFSAVNSYFNSDFISLSGNDEKSGFDGFSELFRRHGGKFSAVCTVNDSVAAGVLKAAKYYKVNVPEDLSVISLCSSNRKNDIDSILYNTENLADEVLDSLAAHNRISTVMFGGSLSVKGTCAQSKSAKESKNMSDFLL